MRSVMISAKIILFSLVIFSQYGSCQLIKPHEFSGRFYPQNPEDLTRYIRSVLSEAQNAHHQVNEKIVGIIVPHAGYQYSGAVAAVSYNAVKQMDIDTVILIGASHRYSYRGIAIWPQGAFSTPLGEVNIDSDVARKFMKLPFIKPDTRFFYDEHSLEVQLPFLRIVLPGAKIVPLLLSDTRYEELEHLASFLDDLHKQKNILVVISSDLSHYHEYEEACRIDARTLEYISGNDYFRLWTTVQLGQRRACGIRPLTAFLMYTDRIGAGIKILQYANSGDTTGDKSKVVGYASVIAFSGEKIKKEIPMSQSQFTDADKKLLLDIARNTLEQYLQGKPIPQFTVDSDIVKEQRGAFVTLKKHGSLRGCIGRIVADTALYKVISDFAVNAAVNDPRFRPVTYDELKDIEIEISVLTPFERVRSLDEIEVGTHGLMLQKGYSSGLLLPQVPVEYNWDKETFLDHLCQKAGLPKDSYEDEDASLYRFSADVFGEE